MKSIDRNDPLRNICLDCGIDTWKSHQHYMVYDPVWAQTGLSKDDGMLCLHCLEKRLGRKLTFDDFTNTPINELLAYRGLHP